MSFAIQHVHVKTKDPKQTMQFYIDNLGATYVAEIPGRGHRVNLHGLTLNITTLISAQNHEQHYGIEHIALDTDDYSGAMSKLRENGVRVLEELPPNNGRRVCFLEAPDGAQIELIEKVTARVIGAEARCMASEETRSRWAWRCRIARPSRSTWRRCDGSRSAPKPSGSAIYG